MIIFIFGFIFGWVSRKVRFAYKYKKDGELFIDDLKRDFESIRLQITKIKSYFKK